MRKNLRLRHGTYVQLGYSLARSIYEDSPERPLSDGVLRDTVVAAAMEAYDNASNPHRGRGGLLKCDDM